MDDLSVEPFTGRNSLFDGLPAAPFRGSNPPFGNLPVAPFSGRNPLLDYLPAEAFPALPPSSPAEFLETALASSSLSRRRRRPPSHPRRPRHPTRLATRHLRRERLRAAEGHGNIFRDWKRQREQAIRYRVVIEHLNDNLTQTNEDLDEAREESDVANGEKGRLEEDKKALRDGTMVAELQDEINALKVERDEIMSKKSKKSTRDLFRKLFTKLRK